MPALPAPVPLPVPTHVALLWLPTTQQCNFCIGSNRCSSSRWPAHISISVIRGYLRLSRTSFFSLPHPPLQTNIRLEGDSSRAIQREILFRGIEVFAVGIRWVHDLEDGHMPHRSCACIRLDGEGRASWRTAYKALMAYQGFMGLFCRTIWLCGAWLSNKDEMYQQRFPPICNLVGAPESRSKKGSVEHEALTEHWVS